MGSKKDYSKDGNYKHYFEKICGLVYGYSCYGRLGAGNRDRLGRGRKRVHKRVEELMREVASWE